MQVPYSSFKLNLVSKESFEREGISFTDASYINVYIDEQNLLDLPFFESAFLVFYELAKSIDDSGKFLLFTCVCGLANHGGWEGVEVAHTNEIVAWHIVTDEFSPADYIFSKEKYVSEINKIREELSSLNVTPEPANVCFPEGCWYLLKR